MNIYYKRKRKPIKRTIKLRSYRHRFGLSREKYRKLCFWQDGKCSACQKYHKILLPYYNPELRYVSCLICSKCKRTFRKQQHTEENDSK